MKIHYSMMESKHTNRVHDPKKSFADRISAVLHNPPNGFVVCLFIQNNDRFLCVNSLLCCNEYCDYN